MVGRRTRKTEQGMRRRKDTASRIDVGSEMAEEGRERGVAPEHSPGHHPWTPPPRGAPLNIGVSVPCRDARMACLHPYFTYS
jgi:hypothetical protein